MENAKKEQVTDAINKWLEAHPGRGLNQLCRENNINKGYASAIKNGKYTVGATVISDEYFYQLMEAIGLISRNSLGFHWDYITNFRTIQNVCKNAQRKNLRLLLEANTGMGKTYALSYYSKLTDRVMYIQITRSTTEASLLTEMCNRLGIENPPRGNHRKMQVIKQHVTNFPNYLIIVDELEYARQAMFHSIKEIADFLEGRAGFIVSGYGLRDKIKRLAELKRNGFPQLKRRFFPNIAMLPEITVRDKKEICEREGITNEQAKNTIAGYCDDLDMLSQVIYKCLEHQRATGKKITQHEVIEMIDDYDEVMGEKQLKRAA